MALVTSGHWKGIALRACRRNRHALPVQLRHWQSQTGPGMSPKTRYLRLSCCAGNGDEAGI